MNIDTPYYLIDESRMIKNLEKIKYVRDKSGAKSVLALKCFSNISAFELMSKYMDGTTSSGPYEARLGYEEFGGETHGYCVGYKKEDVEEIVQYCDKLIFNSVNQLMSYKDIAKDVSIGLRINPMIGWSESIISDPSRKYSRLGVLSESLPENIGDIINGVMFHFNCENENFPVYKEYIEKIGKKYGNLLQRLDWVSLGGGVAFTTNNYPIDNFCELLKWFSEKYDVQIYLEPGEAAITMSSSLIVSVVDIVENGITTLIVDAGVEPHLLDVLVYGYASKLEGAEIIARSDTINFDIPENGFTYNICGRTCLAGDIFGTYKFDHKIKIGDKLNFNDVAGYSMVKKNWFNGIEMPSIVHKKLDGSMKIVQKSTYQDFKNTFQNM